MPHPAPRARAAQLLALAALAPAVLATCSRPRVATPAAAAARAEPAPAGLPALPARPAATASAAFHQLWGDGRAELSGYRAVVPRYGQPRAAEIVLVYVTEPLDRRTWIKDDDAPAAERVTVLKLNESLKFQTGVYPYSVMTSVFAPVDRYRDEAFAPVKLSLSAQEWCGHVFHSVWPDARAFVGQVYSYFASEGEARESTPTEPGALYEDALLIQLRELDGPFARGQDWAGWLVPSLWRARRAHTALRPVRATIARARAALDGAPVHRFVLTAAGFTRTFDVELAPPHRVLAWQTSDGESARIVRTARLPYWQLNRNGDEAQRAAFGLAPGVSAPPADAAPAAGPPGF